MNNTAGPERGLVDMGLRHPDSDGPMFDPPRQFASCCHSFVNRHLAAVCAAGGVAAGARPLSLALASHNTKWAAARLAPVGTAQPHRVIRVAESVER